MTTPAARSRRSGPVIPFVTFTRVATVSGDEDGGFSREVLGSIAVRPRPQWQLSIAPSFLREFGTQQYVTLLRRQDLVLAAGPVTPSAI